MIKKIGISLLLPLILGLVVFLNWDSITLTRLGYNGQARSFILGLEEKEKQEYLEFGDSIDFSYWDTVDNAHHYYDYNLVKGLDKEKVVSRVDTYYNLAKPLKALGYSKSYFRKHYNDYTDAEIQDLVNCEITKEEVQPYLNVKNRIISHISYYLESGLEPTQAVLAISYPGIFSYTDTIYTILEPERTDILVRFGFCLPEGYEPENLVRTSLPSVEDPYLQKEVANSLEQMAKDMEKENLHLGIRSAYRSYDEQQSVYAYYLETEGEAYVQSYVSLPGFSEHQTGLAVDLTSVSVINEEVQTFGETEEYLWCIKNAYKYGFILRYPEDKTSITGAANEPWHFRYVGKEIAKEMMKNNWSLEEYIWNHGFTYLVG
ncbi:MAG: M15 family metallopeptidase [Firmicutes bacterium]|nr:M15 family metallopeptidase [Bacillota bacterium]